LDLFLAVFSGQGVVAVKNGALFMEKSLMLVASTNLMTQETRTDINSALLTIISLSAKLCSMAKIA
jgi:hypothetical protein